MNVSESLTLVKFDTGFLHISQIANRLCNSRMDILFNRRQNLERLIAEFETIAALAAKAGVSQSYLGQIRNRLKTAQGTDREVGHKLARRLEKAAGKPMGWMDGDWRDKVERPYSEDATKVPLIGYTQAGWGKDYAEHMDPADAEEWLSCQAKHGEFTFALRVRGESMEPEFPEGEIIFVDPEVQPRNKDDVVVKYREEEVTLKRYMEEGSVKYLRALNPLFPDPVHKLTDDHRIIGVVIASLWRREE